MLTAIETSLFDILVQGVTDDWGMSRLAAIENRLDTAKKFLTKSQGHELYEHIVDAQSKVGSQAVRTRLNALEGKMPTGT